MDTDILISKFDGTYNVFKDTVRTFLEANTSYKGFSQLIELVNNYDLNQYQLFQAKIDDIVVGLSAVRMLDQILYFDILCVDHDFREIGVADALFANIIDHEDFLSATTYESMALPGDRSTKNFFEQRKGKARLLIIEGTIVR